MGRGPPMHLHMRTPPYTQVLVAAIKFADIGHVVKPFRLHDRWTMMATREFWRLGDREKKMGVSVRRLCRLRRLRRLLVAMCLRGSAFAHAREPGFLSQATHGHAKTRTRQRGGEHTHTHLRTRTRTCMPMRVRTCVCRISAGVAAVRPRQPQQGGLSARIPQVCLHAVLRGGRGPAAAEAPHV